jgi:hypothetical protein
MAESQQKGTQIKVTILGRRGIVRMRDVVTDRRFLGVCVEE